MKQCFLLLLIILAWGCSSPKKRKLPKKVQELKNLTVLPADIQPTNNINLKREISFNTTDEVLIGRMGDIAVDSLGRVFIADVQKQVIDVFGSGGKLITQLGRAGDGPGEFSYLKSLQIHSGLLYATDANFGVRKVNIFTLDTLANYKTILLAKNRSKYQALAKAYPGIFKIYVRDNGTFLAEFISHGTNPTQRWQNKEIKGILYPLDSTGKITSHKLIEFTEEIRTYHMGSLLGLLPIKPFFGNAFTVLSNNNTIYWAGPEYFLIKEYSPEGVYRQAFYYPLKKIPLTQESAVEAGVHDYYIRNMKFMDLPSTWPVLTDMEIDNQDRLWIATTVKNMRVYQWWVLTPKGKLLARFTWPRDKQIEVVKNGYMYALDTNEKTGVKQVVRYKMEMK